jgi:hypothetical protein
MKNLSRERRSPVRDLNPGSTKYEERVLTFRLWRRILLRWRRLVLWVVAPLMMEAVSTCEMSDNFYETKWCSNPDDSHLHIRRRASLKSYNHPLSPMMEAVNTYETSVTVYETARQNNTEDSHLVCNVAVVCHCRAFSEITQGLDKKVREFETGFCWLWACSYVELLWRLYSAFWINKLFKQYVTCMRLSIWAK